MSLDLQILPLFRKNGQELPDLPGLFLADAGISRRSTRSRKGDLLLLHIVLEGTATLSAEDLAQVLETHAQSYFESSGSVTSALREVAEALNDFLLERNREGASEGLQATGLFTGLVLRNEQVFTIQTGPTHLFTIHAVAAQDIHDPMLSGRGLGLGRAVTAHLNHAPLAPGDLIILTPNPPAAWKPDALQKAYGRSMQTIHRVLTNAAGADLRAVILQAQDGKGRFTVLKRDSLSARPPSVPAAPPDRADTPSGAAAPAAAPVKAAAEGREQTAPAEAGGAPPAEQVMTSSLSKPVQVASETPPEEAAPPVSRTAGKALLAVLRAFGSALRAFGYSARATIGRVLPGTDLFTIPASTMAFIAVAVPVLMVTVAGVVYVQRGRLGQYNEYYAKAQEVAEFAATRTDPNEARISWQAVLDYLSLAEEYQMTDETQALRITAFAALDPLDGIERLDFQPALLTALSERVNIVRMVATRDELYMLDETSGSVIRAFLTGRGFEIDTEFKCQSFGNSVYSIGPLIDIAVLPSNNSLEADIFAMDGDGNALYCKDDGSPAVAQSIAPPASNWGEPRSFVLDSGALYVLDPQTNAVWIYSGEDYAYVTPPRLFFDEDVPQMAGVIDFAVDLDDLYMLYEDGHMTTCTFGFAGQPTKCVDPAPFTDPRPGRESSLTVDGALFTQLRFSPPPDPSIYLLDTAGGGIHHYSLRLTYQRQYRPETDIDGDITAFAISSGRMVFLAYGNEVFWAVMP